MAKKGSFFRNMFADASLLFWRILTIVISLLTLFIIAKSAWSIVKSKRHIRQLERRKIELQSSITADSTTIEQLKIDEYLEKYACERYNMHRKDEKIYIIEEQKSKRK